MHKSTLLVVTLKSRWRMCSKKRRVPECNDCWSLKSSAAQLNTSVLLQLWVRMPTQMSLDHWKHRWTGEVYQGGKRGPSEVQRSTSNTGGFGRSPLDEVPKKFPSVQIRLPNLHISSFPHCSLWWLYKAQGEGVYNQSRWSEVEREVAQKVRRR